MSASLPRRSISPLPRSCSKTRASALVALPTRRALMSDNATLGPWIRRFLLEHLVHERNLARNTQRSYRDTLAQIVPFVGGQAHTPVDRLTVIDVTADRVR